MQLRPYQLEAVESVYEHLRTRDDNPCVVIPTGGGKTPVIASICRDAVDRWNGRVVILAHVKELLEQAAEKLQLMAPGLPVGIYSAGLGRRDLNYDVTIAGIQSVYQMPMAFGLVDLVIVDEAHLIPPDGEGMYRQFLEGLKVNSPNVRIIGMTATPFRMKSGTICNYDSILNKVCYSVGVKELIAQGYLSPLRSKQGMSSPDTSGLHTRAGEFVAGETESLMDDDNLVESACAEIVELTKDRKSILIFTSGVQHGLHVQRVMQGHDVECGFIEGNTPADERAKLIDRFKRGDLPYLANVNVLTTGFDAPNVDCVALLRPTLSPGLYYQMVGRGFRLCDGKADCLVLDYGSNVLRHGPIDAVQAVSKAGSKGVAPARVCPSCMEILATGYQVCPICGHVFPREATQHAATASDADPLDDSPEEWDADVDSVTYGIHYKRNDPTGEAPPTLRVDYRCGFATVYSEWICFQHTGYAREKAVQWWRRRSNEPVPDTIEEAIDLIDMGALSKTHRITIQQKRGDRWQRIIKHVIEPPPERVESCDNLPDRYGLSDDDIPF